MYTKADIDAWLGPLTDSEAAKEQHLIRRMMSQVWTFQWGDEAWTGACDGYALVLVAGDYGYDNAPADVIVQWLAILPEQRGPEAVTTLKRLRKFIGPPPDEPWKDHSAVRIARIRVDKRRVARALRGCRDTDVTISGRDECLFVRSEDMRVVVVGSEEDDPVFRPKG